MFFAHPEAKSARPFKIWKIVDKYPLHSDLDDKNLFHHLLTLVNSGDIILLRFVFDFSQILAIRWSLNWLQYFLDKKASRINIMKCFLNSSIPIEFWKTIFWCSFRIFPILSLLYYFTFKYVSGKIHGSQIQLVNLDGHFKWGHLQKPNSDWIWRFSLYCVKATGAIVWTGHLQRNRMLVL